MITGFREHAMLPIDHICQLNMFLVEVLGVNLIVFLIDPILQRLVIFGTARDIKIAY